MASLASLLNPSPCSNKADSSSPPRKTSLPAQSPPERQSSSPTAARPNPSHPPHPTSTAQEAAQALASLSTSPVPLPTEWNGYSAHGGDQLDRKQSWERPQSGHGDHDSTTASRKLSSSGLDHHEAASRSPEHRQPLSQSSFTLPPLQGMSSPAAERTLKPVEVETGASVRSGGMKAGTVQEEDGITHAGVKQEAIATPQPSSPADTWRPSDMEAGPVSSLKNEHSARNQSPLRESSVPIPSTELPAKDEVSKKRPVPARNKKGTASMVKKDRAAPPAKKRKVESKKSGTPASTVKGNSAKGTPMNSSPAPSARSDSDEPNHGLADEEEDSDPAGSDTDLYCICRKPDNGTFMIGCDGTCDDWFHGKCVGIEERDKNLIDKYMCPTCTKAGIGRTTWKRICRRSGCRQPARTGKTKTGGNGSKYCSEECGVLYFREMVARSRGRQEKARDRAGRRKGSLDMSDQVQEEDDIGARGGALAAGEVKALLDASETAEAFKRLGDGVLSPPATPDGKDDKSGEEFTGTETETLAHITTEKEEARRRHALLKDRMKFVTMVKQSATRTAAERELKPKEFCGYDSRLEWSEPRFQVWRESNEGHQAFELETLATEKREENGKDEGDDLDHTMEICDRKKCARHLEWSKLAVDDLRFEMGDNGDRMRALDKQETEIRERAALRRKAGNLNGDGSVELHGSGISTGPLAATEMVAKINGEMDTVEHVESMAMDTSS